MNPKIRELLDRIGQIEEEIEQETRRRRAELHADFERQRIHFEHAVLTQQRRFKTGLWNYVRGAQLGSLLTAPIIYAGCIPMCLLDLFVTLYQWICFPIYGIPRVCRSDYLAFDRNHLAYLNLVEKINCTYCSYGNGLATYFMEVAGRTEQYWCPIKHARRLKQTHSRYGGFLDYGDAEAYRHELQTLRAALARLDEPDLPK